MGARYLKKNKQGFMHGVIILMLSQFIIKIAGLLYKIYLTNKEGFGDTGNAIYSAGFQIYAMFLAISSIGVPKAISQLISSKAAVGDNRGAYRIFKVAISIFGLIGFIGTSILFFNANRIANVFLGIPEAETVIMALSPSVFIVAISAVLKGYFNGREKISVTATSQSTEQILKTVLTIIAVEIFCIISKNNTIVMVASAAIATTAATFFSFMYLYISYIKNKKEIWKDVVTSVIKEKESIRKIVMSILCLFFPIAIGGLLSSTNKTIDAFTTVNTISKFMGIDEATKQYGILTGKVESLVILPYSFNMAFAVNLIPAISAAQARGETEKNIKRVSFSILATILISLPFAAILFTFAEQILKLLFPNAYLGATMLKICSLSIVFVAVTQTIGGVLQGLQRVKETVIAVAIGSVVKLIFNMILLPIEELNIKGAIISTIISNIVIFSINLYYLRKYIKIRFNIPKFIIKPFIATSAMIITAWQIYNNFELFGSKNITLIFSLIMGIIVYIIFLILLKILSKDDIHMLPYGNKVYKTRQPKWQ